MMTRRLLLAALIATGSMMSLVAQEAPKWVRHTALSPDGKLIAFTYKGDLYTVPVEGGRATQITSHPAYDTAPVWSPDGQTLAFASDREGMLDVYTTSREGGVATRLTFNLAPELPVAFESNDRLIFSAGIRPGKDVGLFPSGGFKQLYSLSIQGGRPEMYSPLPMMEPSLRGQRILYTDYKGYEDPMRKHHTSSVTRDVWLGDKKSYRKLTTFAGEDRNPLWAGDEEAFYYTSERDGTLNIYKQALSGGEPTQLTSYKHHPVRYVSADSRGNLAYSWNGELYYLPLGGSPTKVPIRIFADNARQEVIQQRLTSGATDMAISPDGKEVAIVVRGDVYVTSVEYSTTRRITNTPQRERDVAFSPDGRSLVYASERNGKWDIYMSQLTDKADKQFAYAKTIKETQLTDDAKPSFAPKYSPDGKEIAFLRDRTALVVLHLDKKSERVVLDKKYNYSYVDGDQHFEWSPDGQWLISDYIGIGGWNNVDVAIVKADGSGLVHNLTESGYSEGSGKFVLGGKAVAFVSDRAGYRSHGSWGAERDIYLMFLDQEAYDRFRLTKEERTVIFPEKKPEESKAKTDDKKKTKTKKDETKKAAPQPKVAPLTLDLEHRDMRTMRMTRASSRFSSFVMDPKGEKLYYIAYFDGEVNLYEQDLVEKSTKVLIPNVGFGSLALANDGKTLFLASGSGLRKIEGGKPKAIAFEADFEYKQAQERAYILEHTVKLIEDKFYDVNLHGVDWKMYAQNYRELLPYINNGYDFAELLSELLGELNASHTGSRYMPMMRPLGSQTASLGVFYDDSYRGSGAKIAEVMKGGPLDRAKSLARPGVIVEKIDGEPIEADKPIELYLNGKVGRRALVTLYDPQTGKRADESIRLISQGAESGLLYERWIARRAAMVRDWSAGKIGYIHIQGMNSPSFRRTFKELLGKYRHCDAVVIDTRFNGGGWLHEDLAILLGGKTFSHFTPRGQYIGSDPFAQWTKPSIVLMGEGNYSNAHGFPFVYKALGLGKLVGAPVPGTMTAVWWEQQVDPSIVIGVPQVTVTDADGNVLENRQLEPDILVYNSPEQYLADEDAQLKAAVDELLRQTKEVGKKK